MASVWCSMAHDRADTKLKGHLSHADAVATLEATAKRWLLSQPGRRLERVGATEIHLVIPVPLLWSTDGEDLPTGPHIAGHLWIEPCSPPSKPTGGDIYRNANAKGE